MSTEIKHPIKQAIISFFTTFVFCLILWPLLDLFWANIITHSQFEYNFGSYAIEALAFSVIITAIFFLPPILKFRKAKK